ncbi:hypothetical protein ANO11243_018520 [Dothideomycetidae sp. 11243]|nr:hypothetical protein ANO11243_018520 [fungal sp. No.11243]
MSSFIARRGGRVCDREGVSGGSGGIGGITSISRGRDYSWARDLGGCRSQRRPHRASPNGHVDSDTFPSWRGAAWAWRTPAHATLRGGAGATDGGSDRIEQSVVDGDKNWRWKQVPSVPGTSLTSLRATRFSRGVDSGGRWAVAQSGQGQAPRQAPSRPSGTRSDDRDNRQAPARQGKAWKACAEPIRSLGSVGCLVAVGSGVFGGQTLCVETCGVGLAHSPLICFSHRALHDMRPPSAIRSSHTSHHTTPLHHPAPPASADRWAGHEKPRREGAGERRRGQTDPTGGGRGHGLDVSLVPFLALLSPA